MREVSPGRAAAAVPSGAAVESTKRPRVTFPPDSDAELCEYDVDEPPSAVSEARATGAQRKWNLKPSAESRTTPPGGSVPPEELERRRQQSERDKEATKKKESPGGKARFSNPFFG